jgi:hypothetical protein
MIKILYAVQELTPNDIIVLTQDGGVATIHKVEDEHRYLTTYYQDRTTMPLFDDVMWDTLSEGKVHLKDWVDKDKIDGEMIMDAVKWLMYFVPEEQFESVEFNFLTNQILKN